MLEVFHIVRDSDSKNAVLPSFKMSVKSNRNPKGVGRCAYVWLVRLQGSRKRAIDRISSACMDCMTRKGNQSSKVFDRPKRRTRAPHPSAL